MPGRPIPFIGTYSVCVHFVR